MPKISKHFLRVDTPQLSKDFEISVSYNKEPEAFLKLIASNQKLIE